jgi:hypothetical protein
MQWGRTRVVLRIRICPMIQQQLHNIGGVSKVATRSCCYVQWEFSQVISEVDIGAMFDQNLKYLELYVEGRSVKWSAALATPGVYIRPVIEQPQNKVQSSIIACHIK